jgi:hypothetical protein
MFHRHILEHEDKGVREPFLILVAADRAYSNAESEVLGPEK